MKQTILLFGKNGQIGWELQRSLAHLGHVVAVGREDVDLTNEDDIRTIIRAVEPTTIVNAAAYTAVDAAEDDPVICSKINSVAPGIMAGEANAIGALMVHYSTDYVFSGTDRKTPYTEDDSENPLSVYGQTKLVGDLAVRRVAERYLNFRTSWVYSNRGKNFYSTINRMVRDRDVISVVDDQVGCPTWARSVAEVTASALTQVFNSEDAHVFYGLYNVCSAEPTTWHKFAVEIASYTPPDHLICKDIRPVTTEEYVTKAKRPAYSAMDCSKLKTAFNITVPPWYECLHLAASV